MADVNANIGVNIDTSEALAQLKSLQRQISQFHSSIAKSSEAAALAQRDLQRNFLNSVNALGAFSAELRTVKTTSESFTTSLEKNKFSMREYFRYAGASTKTFGRLFRSEYDTIAKVAEDRVKTLQTQYIKMGRDASGAMKAIAIRPDQLDMGSYSTQVQIAAQKQALFNQLMKQGSTNLLNFGKNTQWAGRQLMVGFTLPLMAVGSVASKTFMEMEAQALKFKKVYGDLFTPQAETDQALADIQALGREFTKYGIAVSETVGLAADAAAAGFSGIDLQRQTTEATRLSVLGQIDNQQALQTTISLQNAFAISSDKLADSINFLNAVENQTVTSLDDITVAIPKVAPVIQQLGGDVKDLAFFLTAMKEGGVNASEGANALKSGLASLINPTNSARKMLKGMNIDIDAIVNNNKGDLKATVIGFAQALDTLAPLARARAIETMFGKFQFARLSTLFQNVTKDGTQASRVLQLAGSSVEDLAALSEKELGMTADSAMNKFRKAVEDLKFAIIPVGEAFLKTITPIIDAVTNIAEKFSNLSDGTKKAITVMVTVVGGLGPVLLMTFGLLANGVANIIKLFVTLRTGYQKLTGQSKNLGEQTQYMTMEQLDAAAAAHSLNQAHATLTQQFTVEASAVEALRRAYEGAIAAGARFASINPGMMMPPKKMADGGLVVGPGTGTSDSVPTMLSNGESVIPADKTKKYGGLIRGIIAGNIPGFARGVVNFGGRDFNIPMSSRTTQGAIEGVLARFSKDIEGLSLALDALEANAQQLGMSFQEMKADDLKTFLDEFGVARNRAKGTSSSGGFVFAHAQERGSDIRDIQELERLVSLASDTTKGIGKYLKASLEALKAGEAAKIQLAAAEKEQASLIERLNSAKTDAEKSAIQSQLAAIEETKSLALGIIKAADAAKVYTLSNFGFVLPEEANKGKMAPKNVAEQFTGDNVSRTMAPIYAEYARKLGMSLDQALADPSIAAQMHADMAQFGQLISNEIGTVTTEFLSDPDFYAAVERARQGLAGVVSDVLIDAVNDLKRTSTVVTQGGAVNRGAEGQRIGVAQKETALRDYLGVAQGGSSYRDIGTAGYVAIGETIGSTTVAGVARGAGTASPSKKTIPVGEDIVRGVEVGMGQEAPMAVKVAEQVANDIVAGAQRGARTTGNITPGAPTTIEKTKDGKTISVIQKNVAEQRIAGRAVEASEKLAKMNSAVMGASFALTGVAGVAQMFGGTIGKLSNIVFSLSGVLFALMSVTQALTQTQALKLAVDRASLIAGRMQGLGKTAEGAQIGGKISSLFTKGGGFVGFMKNIVTAGKFALRFAGGIGLAITVISSAIAAFQFWKKKNEEARVAIEGLGDAALLSTEKVKTLGDFFGVKTQTTRLERTGAQLVLDQQTRSKVDELRGSEGFKKNFKNDINALKGATDGQAELIFKSLAIQLKGKGFAKENIDTIIKALQEESGKANVKIDFDKIDLSTKEGQKDLQKTALKLGNSFGKQFGVGYSEQTKTAINASTGQVVTWTEQKLTKGLQKNLSLVSKSFAGMINGLSGQLENGSITAQKFNQSFDTISTTIEKMPKPQALLLMDNIIKSMPGPLAKSALGIKNVADQMLIAKAAALGIATITPAMIKALQTAATSTDARAGLAASRVRAKIKEDMKAIQEVMALVSGNNKPEGTNEGTGEKSKLQLAIEQLQKQRSELQNTAKAYSLLTKAGLDAAVAMEYAKDPVIALGLATKGLSIDQVKKLAEIMKDIEKSASSQAIKEFFLNVNKENKIKESLSGVASTISQMGGSLEDINNILGNPELASYLLDPLLTSEQSAERIKRYLDGIKTGKELDLKIKLSTPEGVAEAFSDLSSKASGYFDILERSIQDRFADPIKAAEVAAEKAADAVKAIQLEIDGLTNQSSIIQRQMDITINRPLDLLQQRNAVLSENMALIDNAAEKVNAKYDEQANALAKISEINQEIANQQKQQIDLASAITSGDIAAAARAEQEMRAQAAAAASGRAGGVLDVARQRELAGLTANGMTAEQIKAEQYQIERKTFALEQQRLPLTQAIQAIEDKIYSIQNGKLATAQKTQEEADAALIAKKNELQAELNAIDVQRTRWNQAQLAIDNAKIAAGEFDDVINATNDKVAKLADMWKSLSTSKNINIGGSAVNDMVKAVVEETSKTATTAATDTAKTAAEVVKGFVPTLVGPTANPGAKGFIGPVAPKATTSAPSSNFTPTGLSNKLRAMGVSLLSGGGMVPKYFATGGYSMGTDTVPAMLTPGEFVVKRFAVDKFGVNNLKAINDGTFTPKSTVASVNNNSNSVYNYGISVNVSNSNASTDDIARAVITQIRNIDNQRIRGQR
jgi:TP901 family phage tail tape measure protein